MELNIFQKTRKLKKKHIKTNIYRVQAFDSIICGYFCIEFIDFMFKDKSVLDYIDLFSPDDYEKNGKMVLKCFQLFSTRKMKKLYCVICHKYRKFEKPKISYLLEKSISSFYYLQHIKE